MNQLAVPCTQPPDDNWPEWVTFARRVRGIAQDVVHLDNVQPTAIIPVRLFTDTMTVNYADSLVAIILHRCLQAA
jgi:hypothetical protein